MGNGQHIQYIAFKKHALHTYIVIFLLLILSRPTGELKGACIVPVIILAPFLWFNVCRPHAECGPGAGEAVSGGEAHGSGGAEDDVRARAGVSTATAVTRENAAAPPQQQRPPHVPHDARTARQAAAVDRGTVGAAFIISRIVFFPFGTC